MLVHHVSAPHASVTILTFGASGDPDERECEFSEGGCVIELNQVIVDIASVASVGWARLNRRETMDLAKFLLRCAAVMEDEE